MTHPSSPTTATLAPEVRFRVRAANSAPREVRVVVLSDDDATGDATRACVAGPFTQVHFSAASELAGLLDTGGMQEASWPRTLNAASDAIAAWLGSPDLAIIVGIEGDDAGAAALAAQAWRMRGVTVSALIRPAASASPACENASTRQRTADLLRPWCTMLVLASGSDYLVDLLSALGVSLQQEQQST